MKSDRKPLQWKDEDKIIRGHAQIEIQSARTDRGVKMYSFSISKPPKGEGSRPSRFFRRRDLDQILDPSVLQEIDYWIDADRDEDQKSQSKHRRA